MLDEKKLALKLELERAGRRQFLGAVCVADMAAQAGLGDWSRWDAASEAAEKLLRSVVSEPPFEF